MSAGRPTKYLDSYAEQARKLCLLGATDEEISDFFGVCVATIYNWKVEYPGFLDAVKSGKTEADAHLADKLYSRAQGAEWEEEQAIKVKVGAHEERVEVVTVKRAAPPDTTALIFWLKNRKPTRWRDKQEIDVNHNGLAASARDEDLAAIALAGVSAVTPPKDDKA